VARPNLAFDFVNWTDNGTIASTNATYQFTIEVNRSLVANFAASVIPRLAIQSTTNAVVLSWATNFAGFRLERNVTLAGTNWTSVTNEVTVVGATRQVVVSPIEGDSFFRLNYP
jgi:Flp pilus assembly protein TadG